MKREPALEARFARRLKALLADQPRGRLLVAVSGGIDSVVLLHLLRFSIPSPPPLAAAHLDHGMRDSSAADADWVEGLCRAWGVELIRERLDTPPKNEEAARDARYAFLRRAAARAGADGIATAHHADDQAETVLFRALRGTGLRGLAGIPDRTADGIIRPLLPFWREDIEAYAGRRCLRWREDATNYVPGAARNRIRLELLPKIERELVPSARRNLVRLAVLAAEAERALEAVTEEALAASRAAEGDGFSIAREIFRGYDAPIRSRVLRRLLRRLGVVPDRAGTRATLEFITDAPSGRELTLPQGVRVRSEFDRVWIGRPGPPAEEQTLEIGPESLEKPVSGPVVIGGARYDVRVDPSPPDPAEEIRSDWSAAIPVERVQPPLTIRGWRPGDRMRTPGGTKTLKKLFLEHRIPRSQRGRLPVLADAAGRVVWVAGIPIFAAAPAREGEDAIFLTITDA